MRGLSSQICVSGLSISLFYPWFGKKFQICMFLKDQRLHITSAIFFKSICINQSDRLLRRSLLDAKLQLDDIIKVCLVMNMVITVYSCIQRQNNYYNN